MERRKIGERSVVRYLQAFACGHIMGLVEKLPLKTSAKNQAIRMLRDWGFMANLVRGGGYQSLIVLGHCLYPDLRKSCGQLKENLLQEMVIVAA